MSGITAKDCTTTCGFIRDAMISLGLMNADEDLVIESGSATYGRAWKVFVTGGQYGSAWHNPPFGSFYSGSARELHGKLLAVLGTLDAVRYVRERSSDGVTA